MQTMERSPVGPCTQNNLAARISCQNQQRQFLADRQITADHLQHELEQISGRAAGGLNGSLVLASGGTSYEPIDTVATA
jgi:hypothetical protein